MTGARPAPWLIAAGLALAWLAFAPPTPDLAAQVYRAGLFRSEGFTLFNANWYGGHHTPAYSILFPPLGALLGVRVVGVVAAVASAVLFERIARAHFGERARWGALWFGAGTVADLLIGRLTFAVGVAFALAAVYALQRGHRRSGLALGVCCTLGSPVAGLFLALAGIAHARRPPRAHRAVARRRGDDPRGRAVGALSGGRQPAVLGRDAAGDRAVLRHAAVAAARPRARAAHRGRCCTSPRACWRSRSRRRWAATRAAWASRSPGRCCCARCARAARSGACSSRTMAALFVWQWWAPVRETVKGAVDPSGQAAYFEPMLDFLDTRAEAAIRVEVPFTRLHWESVYVARDVPLARGWVTQLDVKLNPLFRCDAAQAPEPGALPPLARARGGALRRAARRRARPERPRRGRAHPARPAVPARRLPRPPLGDLRGAGHAGPGRRRRPRHEGRPAGGRSAMSGGPGFTLVRVRFTPYWRIARGRGCVMRGAGGWTLVYALSRRSAAGRGGLRSAPPDHAQGALHPRTQES